MEDSLPLAAARCPLCQGDNDCALVRDARAGACWCMRQSLSTETKLRAARAGESCICRRCAGSH